MLKFVVKRSIWSGDWYWSLRAANNKKIATSGEGYGNRKDCLHAIEIFKDKAKLAPVLFK